MTCYHLVDSALHTALDKYELFAITASLDFGKEILEFLQNDLRQRQMVMDQMGYLVPRSFQVSGMNTLFPWMSLMSVQYFRAKPELQLVVLHPGHLLPDHFTLLRCGPNGYYTPYKASSDGLLREVDTQCIISPQPSDPSSPPFPSFSHTTTRPLYQSLNIYFILLNAEIKFQRFAKHFGVERLHPDMRAVVNQTNEIVDLMYAQPKRSEACQSIQVSARDERSLRPRLQGPGAISYAEDMDYQGEAQRESAAPSKMGQRKYDLYFSS